jgi:hypothetical protein
LALEADLHQPSAGVTLTHLAQAMPLKKDLPRRANHRHIFIIAKIENVARAGKLVAGFFESQFLNRTAAAGRTNLP